MRKISRPQQNAAEESASEFFLPSSEINLVDDNLSPVDCLLSSRKQFPVQRTILDRFANVFALDAVAAGEVGDGSCDFEDAVVGAGGEVHLFHGVFEVANTDGIEGAVLAHELGGHGGIGREIVACKTPYLNSVRSDMDDD
jgi:hypothetical protein